MNVIDEFMHEALTFKHYLCQRYLDGHLFEVCAKVSYEYYTSMRREDLRHEFDWHSDELYDEGYTACLHGIKILPTNQKHNLEFLVKI